MACIFKKILLYLFSPGSPNAQLREVKKFPIGNRQVKDFGAFGIAVAILVEC